MKKMFSFFIAICLFTPFTTMAVEPTQADLKTIQQSSDFQTTEEILSLAHNEKPTNCASEIFSNTLQEHDYEVSETDEEPDVKAWAYQTMLAPDIIKQILECPEIKQITDDEETIHFTPIIFRFSDEEDARTLTIKFSTQKKVLKQHLILSTKRSLPNGDPNPKLMDPNDPAIYINTDPAWYAIMVVQHDALKDFVGPDKNNTLSMKYLDENIDKIYPRGYFCTSKSAWANDADTINNVVHELVDIENDTNDYYVAGDINLEWVMYAEIALDVVLTVATVGVGEGMMIGLKGARAAKTAARLSKNATNLKRFEHISKYASKLDNIVQVSSKIEKNTANLKNAKKYENILKKAEKARAAGKDVSKYEKQAEKVLREAKEIDPSITPDKLKDVENLKSEVKQLEKELPDLKKDLEETTKEYRELLKEQKKALAEVEKTTDSKKIKEYKKLQREMDKLRDSKDYSEITKKSTDPKIQKRIEEIEKQLEEFENADDFKDYAKLYNEVTDLSSVDNYAKTFNALQDVNKYRKDLFAFRRPQTGNIVTKNLKRIKSFGKTLKAANRGAKTLRRAGRIGRSGMSSFSAKAKDFLFDQTLKHGARIGRLERDVGLVYGALNFMGDMYDKTSTTNNEYSNGIEMKPFCLLSADDLEGQDNVVNYGMWLLWQGNSTDAADDDAAYLQAMDFAEKFAHELEVYQDELPAVKTAQIGLAPKPFPRSAFLCNVDIFVVRPIIRLDESDPAETKGELFYLIMNDIPWTTADQFGEIVPDVEAWERSQQQYASEDPMEKNPQQENEENSVEASSDDVQSETQTPSEDMSYDEQSQTENISANAVAFVPTSQPSSTSSVDDLYCKKHTNNDATIFRDSPKCNQLSGNDISRCKKCINHAGTYENGRCYIEVLHWVCRDKGWSSNNGRSCDINSQYDNCGLIRKYVDAEKPFTCPRDGVLSGCCQHGNSSGAKHPPVNLSGSKFIDMDCKMPLSSNLNWRIAYTNGSAIGLSGHTTRSWCMPNASLHPWNDANQPGGSKHCAKTIPGGSSLQYWHSLN